MRKMQTWIRGRSLPSGNIERTCSNCGFRTAWVSSKWKYCPVCGFQSLRSIPGKERVNEVDTAEG